jgi:hypothetical protein
VIVEVGPCSRAAAQAHLVNRVALQLQRRTESPQVPTSSRLSAPAEQARTLRSAPHSGAATRVNNDALAVAVSFVSADANVCGRASSPCLRLAVTGRTAADCVSVCTAGKLLFFRGTCGDRWDYLQFQCSTPSAVESLVSYIPTSSRALRPTGFPNQMMISSDMTSSLPASWPRCVRNRRAAVCARGQSARSVITSCSGAHSLKP